MGLSCIVIDDEIHAIGELSDLIEDSSQLVLKRTFSDVPASIEFLEDEGSVDVVFCDINMPNMDGLTAAEHLQPFCRFLVFVTGYREHALEAFEKNAAGYLMKPISEDSFNKLINTFVLKDKEFLADNIIEKHGVFFVKGARKNEAIKVNIDEIKYIKSDLNYIVIHLEDNTNIMTYILLGDLEKRLKRFKQFFRVNKSTIISMRFFKKIEGNTIYLSVDQGGKLPLDDDSFTIGSKYKAALLSFIKERSLNF